MLVFLPDGALRETMGSIERDGAALHFHEEGDGPPVVLLHGHALDLRVWDDLAPALVEAGYRAIRYDQRGHGKSSSPSCGYRYGDHAADLAALLDDREAVPAHVIALSKGAGIALEAVIREPRLASSLLLVAPFIPDFPISQEMLSSFRDFARLIRTAGVEAAVRNLWLSHPLIATTVASVDARNRLEVMALGFPAGEYLATARDAPDRDWRLVDRLAEIAVATLIVSGEHEVDDLVAMATLLGERIAASRIVTVARSRHLVPLECPAELARLAISFLADQPA